MCIRDRDNNIVVFQHEGFSKEANYIPIVSFCDFYGLELPKLPILNPEFNNPLFLKLMCEYCVNKFKEFDQTISVAAVSYTHLRAHETLSDLVCRLLLEKKRY
ncbi:hypothetical protein JMUB7556_28150 [Staphylococcus aureus]